MPRAPWFARRIELIELLGKLRKYQRWGTPLFLNTLKINYRFEIPKIKDLLAEVSKKVNADNTASAMLSQFLALPSKPEEAKFLKKLSPVELFRLGILCSELTEAHSELFYSFAHRSDASFEQVSAHLHTTREMVLAKLITEKNAPDLTSFALQLIHQKRLLSPGEAHIIPRLLRIPYGKTQKEIDELPPEQQRLLHRHWAGPNVADSDVGAVRAIDSLISIQPGEAMVDVGSGLGTPLVTRKSGGREEGPRRNLSRFSTKRGRESLGELRRKCG